MGKPLKPKYIIKGMSNMKIAFLFPGQGTQFIGMGKDIYEKYEVARKVYDKVQEITGIDIAKLSFEGPSEVLNETKNTQLAILTNSLAILEVLKENNIEAEVSAGLSLGEYTALIYSKYLSFEDGINIVQKRGEYMQNLLPQGNWQMAAVLGLKDEEVEEVCKKVKTGFVVPANYNFEGQIVISGEKDAVLEAGKLAKEKGARGVIPLNTAGPFHTEKLKEASNALRKELESVNIKLGSKRVYKNIDGETYSKNDNIKEILAKHIISPVRFSKIIQNMIEENVDTFIEIGPGKTLSNFVKKSSKDKDMKIFNITNVESLEESISKLNNLSF